MTGVREATVRRNPFWDGYLLALILAGLLVALLIVVPADHEWWLAVVALVQLAYIVPILLGALARGARAFAHGLLLGAGTVFVANLAFHTFVVWVLWDFAGRGG